MAVGGWSRQTRQPSWSDRKSHLSCGLSALSLTGYGAGAPWPSRGNQEHAGLTIVLKRSSLRSDRSPRTPEGVRIYAVGDVHGRADLLAPLLLQIEIDLALHPVSRPIVVCLGDYIDRGPASRQVLDLLVAYKDGREAVFLKGNHETFLLKFLEDAAALDGWRYNGGLETLVSYGLRPPINPNPLAQAQLARDLDRVMPDAHRAFLKDLKLSFVCGDYLFVHAGVRPLVSLERQAEDDLLWIRDDFLLWEKPFEKMVVHGHTPVHEPEVHSNRINIDTGAFATGRLTCLLLDGADIMPLVDVRDWSGRLPAFDISGGAVIHAGQIKDRLAALDSASLRHLDPRPRGP